MRGFANTVLVGVFALFILLGVSWASLQPLANLGSPLAAAASPSIHDVEAHLVDDRTIRLELRLHNAGVAATSGAWSATIKVAGEKLGAAQGTTVKSLPATIEPGADEPFQLDVRLTPDAAARYLDALRDDPEAAGALDVEGSVRLLAPKANRDLDFQARLALAEPVTGAVAALSGGCQGSTTRLCVDGPALDWSDGRAYLTLAVENPTARTLQVENLTFTLRDGLEPIASGAMVGGRALDAGESTTLRFRLELSPESANLLWRRATEGCDADPLGARLRIQAAPLVDGDLGRPISLSWTMREDPEARQDGSVCGGP